MIQNSAAHFRAPKIDLPRIDRDLARHMADLSAHDLSGTLQFGEESWGHAHRVDAGFEVKTGTKIDLLLDGAPITLSLTTQLIDWIEELDDYFEPYDELAPERLALVLEHILSEEIEALEKVWKRRIELVAVHLKAQIETAAQLAAWDITGAALGATFEAYLDAGDRSVMTAQLTGAFPERKRRSLQHLKVPAVWFGPIATMRVRALQRMREGCVFFPSPDWTSTQQMACYIGWGHNIMRVRHEDDGIATEGPEEDLNALYQKYPQGGTMIKGGNPGQDAAGNPVTVMTVELARQEMSVSEIEGIRQGAILEFDIHRVEEVTLCAGGTAVAAGRLVQLDDAIGVQVTRLL